MQSYFDNFEGLNSYIQNNVKGSILVSYRNCADYEGMVLGIMIVFDGREPKYELDLQWMSMGLDLYGDTLQESYVYQFVSLEALLEYLLLKYHINISDIPLKYQFDLSQFPNPIKDEAKKPLFEAAWQKFLVDFENGAFLDPSLKLVYDSLDR